MILLLLALAVGSTTAAGVYLSLSKDLLRCVVGISLIGLATNLALFTTGNPTPTAPPIVQSGEVMLPATAANPLPQALVLTAIVIGFVLTCFSLVLILALKQTSGVADVEAIQAAEPPPGSDGKPRLEEH